MFNHFGGHSANCIWKCAADLLIAGDCEKQSTRLGESKELLHATVYLSDPRQRWVSARKPAISPAFAIAELFWICGGHSDSAFINYWNPSLPKFAGNAAKYHGAYGHRIRTQFGLDQLESAYRSLSQNPISRQVVIQIWDPRTDLPVNKGEPMNDDIPCNICSILKIRDNKLEWLQVIRSNDIFLGMPYNIIQFTTLQEIMAGWLNVNLGGYHQISDSLHAYDHDLEKYTTDNAADIPENTDNLAIEKSESDKALAEIYMRLNRLTNNKLTKVEFLSIAFSNPSNIPESFINLLLICCAYAARKRKWDELVRQSIAACTNDTLVFAWALWARNIRG